MNKIEAFYARYIDGTDWGKTGALFTAAEAFLVKALTAGGLTAAQVTTYAAIGAAVIVVLLLTITKRNYALAKNLEDDAITHQAQVDATVSALATAKAAGAATVGAAAGVAVDAVKTLADEATTAAATKSEPVTPLPSFADQQTSAADAATVPNAADVILSEAPAMIAAGPVKVLDVAPVSPDAADSLAMQSGSKPDAATSGAADVPETPESPSAVNVASNSGTVAVAPVAVVAPPPAPEVLAATTTPAPLFAGPRPSDFVSTSSPTQTPSKA